MVLRMTICLRRKLITGDRVPQGEGLFKGISLFLIFQKEDRFYVETMMSNKVIIINIINFQTL